MACSVAACERPRLARGMCQFHYDHARRYPDQPIDYIRPSAIECATCGATQEVGNRGELPILCRRCARDQHRRLSRERRHRTNLRNYGLTPEDYAALLATQGGVCAICRTDRPGGRGKRFHVDHNHDTGRVRGLLCHGCNTGIGALRDDPDLLETAVRYLRKGR